MLVSEVLDRTLSVWLHPAGQGRPSFDTLTDALLADATDKAVAISGRIQNVPRDSVLEIGSELITVSSVSGVNITASERGYLDTAVAAHAVGDLVLLNPDYPRKTLLDALISIIATLYPMGLYARAVDTAQTFSTSAVKTLPSGGKDILGILVRTSGSEETYNPPLVRGRDYEVFREFDPPKYQLYRGGTYLGTMTVVYSKDFTAPTAETDNLDTIGIPAGLQPHLPMAVAGYLLQGKDLPRVVVEEIRRALASQGIQVGAALNIGQVLLQQFERRYVANELKRQRERDPVTFEFTRR